MISPLLPTDDATSHHSLPNSDNLSPILELAFLRLLLLLLGFSIWFLLYVIQMSSLEAAGAASDPNISDWVVYLWCFNVSLAEPAAKAVVWKGMRLITQTDRHTNVCKKHYSTITGTGTQKMFFLYNKQTEAMLLCFSFNCSMKQLTVFPFSSSFFTSESANIISLAAHFLFFPLSPFPFAFFMVQWLEISNCHWISS